MRSTLAVIGGQDGDEGKGEIVAYYVLALKQRLSSDNRLVVYKPWGGHNSGHHATIEGHNYKSHLIPVGIFVPGTYNLVGKGTYVNPRKLVKEIEELRQQGVEVSPKNLGIASNAHVTLDSYVEQDSASFQRENWTSTGNGIKQTAEAKYARKGVRLATFLDPERMTEFLRARQYRTQESTIDAKIEELVRSYSKERDLLREYQVLESDIISDPKVEFLIEEGPQGVMLDINDGAYPGVTSSHPSLPVYNPEKKLLVFKLYKSSVGHGDRPFISQIPSKTLEGELRDEWGERGTTTGRNRSIGYFDAVEAKYAIDCVQPTHVVATCGDRMEAFHRREETIKIVVGYDINGTVYARWDPSFHAGVLWDAKPVYKELRPWEKFSEDGKLTPPAQEYIDALQELLGREFSMIKTGREQSEVIFSREIV